MITNQSGGWQELFQAAILETNVIQLREKIEAALAAIECRFLELPALSHARNEAQQLVDATQTLRLLQKTELRDTEISGPQDGKGRESVTSEKLTNERVTT
jgi:hypothetical protein